MDLIIAKVSFNADDVRFFFYEDTLTREEIQNDISNMFNTAENPNYELSLITYDEYFEWYDNRNLDPKTKAEIFAELGVEQTL